MKFITKLSVGINMEEKIIIQIGISFTFYDCLEMVTFDAMCLKDTRLSMKHTQKLSK